MARLPRVHLAGVPEHIIQRGNNRQVCFANDEDFVAYAHWSSRGQSLLFVFSVWCAKFGKEQALTPLLHFKPLAQVWHSLFLH